MDLKHELAEQIKEKTRHMNSATSSSTNGGLGGVGGGGVVSASLSPSFTTELENQIAGKFFNMSLASINNLKL